MAISTQEFMELEDSASNQKCTDYLKSSKKLAKIYLHGQYIDGKLYRNAKKAIEYYKQAADKGDAESALQLYYLLSDNDADIEGIKPAIEYLNDALNSKYPCPEAFYALFTSKEALRKLDKSTIESLKEKAMEQKIPSFIYESYNQTDSSVSINSTRGFSYRDKTNVFEMITMSPIIPYKSHTTSFFRIVPDPKSPYYVSCKLLIHDTDLVLSYIKYLTGYNVDFNNDIYLTVSDATKYIKHCKYPVSEEKLIELLGELLKEIDDLHTEEPYRYKIAWGWYESQKNKNNGDLPYYNSNFKDISLERIIDILRGNGDNYGWITWADHFGNEEIKSKIKKIINIYGSLQNYLVSVDYDSITRTITLYNTALGNPSDYFENWRLAYAEGLFMAFYSDLRKDKGRKYTNIVEESLTSYFAYYYDTDLLKSGQNIRLRQEWTLFDMSWWPYSGAQYLDKLFFKEECEHYFFKRTYKKSLTDINSALKDIILAYELCEEKKFLPLSSKLHDASKFEFNGICYNKKELALNVVKDYVANHPDVTIELLKNVFDYSIAKVHIIESTTEAKERIARSKSKVLNPRCSIYTKGGILHAKDGEFVVSTEWSIDTILKFIEKAKALGYKINKL